MADTTPAPPQQARSRAALQRLLRAAEHVLVIEGADGFTIARVAEQAEVSVGGVYRRFANKEQLINAVRLELVARLESAVTEALSAKRGSLAGVVDAFTAALSRTLADSGRMIPAVLAGARSAQDTEYSLRTLVGLHQQFIDAAAPHRSQIRHPDPDGALGIAFRSMVATGTHRAAIAGLWPDHLTWPQWAHEIAAMTTTYLTVEPPSDAGSTGTV